MRKCSAYINGQLIETKNSFIRENPATLEPLQEVYLCSEKEISMACEAANGAFGVWSSTPGNVRGSILFKIAEKIREQADHLSLINTEETGKPINESKLVELAGVARTFEYYAGLASKIQGESQIITQDLISFTIKEPIGVVAMILPWNFHMHVSYTHLTLQTTPYE